MASFGLLGRRGRASGLLDLFPMLAETAPDGLALLDAEGRLLAFNPALARLAGPVASLRCGLPVASILAPATREAFAAALDRGQSAPLQTGPADPAAPADAAWSVRLVHLPAEAGPAVRWLLRAEDQTPLRRAEARLAGAGRLETVGRLAGGIAHDFNNLLAVILGAAESVRAAGLSPMAAADLAQVEDAARRGAALVGQLLAFARQQRLQPRVLDLNEAVTGLAPLLRRLLGGRVRLDLALEQPGRRVRVDPTQLDQVILNLAVNARDAMPGGGTLRIATGHQVVLRAEGERAGEGVGTVPPGRWVVLEVSDTGIGIPPEAQSRLFEPFYTTRLEKGGTGLGLATVQGIVAQSGGHITVESQVGQGARFRIHLPRPDALAAPAPAPALAPPPGVAILSQAPPPPASGPVLMVDDEAPLRLLGTRLLERAGHGVLATDSAEAALALVEAGAMPGLLVSDMAMPGMDGLDLARALRRRFPGLPVLLLSGYAGRMLDRDLGAEGIRFLAKPFLAADLLREVASALGREPPAAASDAPIRSADVY